MNSYRLTLFILIHLLSFSQGKPSDNSSSPALGSLSYFLQSKDPQLSLFCPQSLTFQSLTFQDPIFLYEKAYLSLHLNLSLKIRHISLPFSDFTIDPLLAPKQNPQTNLTVIFSPRSSGTQTAYLSICTQSDFFIYSLTATASDSPFELLPISIEYFQGTYGVTELHLSNPYPHPIDNFFLKSSLKEISISKTKSPIAADTRSEIGIIRVYFEHPGTYNSVIELRVNKTLMFIPVSIKVLIQRLELTSSIDYGIILSIGGIYFAEIYAWNYGRTESAIQTITSDSSEITAQKVINVVQPFSRKLLIARIQFKPMRAGRLDAVVVVETQGQVFEVKVQSVVELGILQILKNTFTYNPMTTEHYVLELASSLPGDLHIYKCESLHRYLTISSPSIIHAFGISSLKLSVFSARFKAIVQLHTDLGLIQFRVDINDPVIRFSYLLKGEYTDLKGPLNLGASIADRQLNLAFLIHNNNKFSVQIDLIESIHNSRISMPRTNLIPAESAIEVSVSLKCEKSLFSPLIFHTSIGSFFITVVVNVVPGQLKVKPVYFSDVTPGTLKEQLVYFTNSFPLPIKIISISSTSGMLSFESTKDFVLPEKEQVVGKLRLNYQRNDKVNVDWNKSLTYADARAWNALNKFWSDGEKIGALIITTDIVGELEVAVFIASKQPRKLATTLPQFHNCKYGDTCQGFFKVTNPLSVPISVQLLVVPEYFLQDLRSYDCSKQTPTRDVFDEEFENVNNEYSPLMKKRECLTRPSEEIFAVKKMNEKKPLKSKVYHSGDLSLVGKIANAIFEEEPENYVWGHAGEEAKRSQSHFVMGMQMVVPPKSSKVVGPAYFQPQFVGEHNLSFVLRNNYTIIEGISVAVTALQSKLAFVRRAIYHYSNKEYYLHKNSIKKELNKLNFDISQEEINKFVIDPQRILTPHFVRTFELQNSGNADMEIFGISFENAECNFEGFILYICGKNLLLKPQESLTIQVSYMPSLSFGSKSAEILILSSSGFFSYSLEATISDESVLSVFLTTYGSQAIILDLSLTIAIILLVFKAHFYITKEKYKARRSNEMTEIVISRFFCKKYSQPIFFMQNIEVFPEVKEPEKPEEPPVEPVHSKSKKKVKIRRNLANTIIQKAEDLKLNKNAPQLPEVIATNKLLIEKKKTRTVSDDPAPKPRETVKSLEIDDDVYIDSYKRNNILFGYGFSDKESLGLAELTQDSDPLDSLLD